MTDKFLIVAIHDFSSSYVKELKVILNELDNRGFDTRSILVSPKQGCTSIKNDEKLVNLILDEKDKKNEICLHGLIHSKGKGHHELKNIEFRKISYDNALNKIKIGKSELNSIGIDVKGFVPPLWKISREGQRALKDEKFRFLVKNPKIIDFKTNTSYSYLPVWFFPYNLPLDYTFRYYNKFLTKLHQLKSSKLVRIEIHPQDVWKRKPFDYALKLIDRLSKDREFISYEGFLNQVGKV